MKKFAIELRNEKGRQIDSIENRIRVLNANPMRPIQSAWSRKPLIASKHLPAIFGGGLPFPLPVRNLPWAELNHLSVLVWTEAKFWGQSFGSWPNRFCAWLHSTGRIAMLLHYWRKPGKRWTSWKTFLCTRTFPQSFKRNFDSRRFTPTFCPNKKNPDRSLHQFKVPLGDSQP